MKDKLSKEDKIKIKFSNHVNAEVQKLAKKLLKDAAKSDIVIGSKHGFMTNFSYSNPSDFDEKKFNDTQKGLCYGLMMIACGLAASNEFSISNFCEDYYLHSNTLFYNTATKKEILEYIKKENEEKKIRQETAKKELEKNEHKEYLRLKKKFEKAK